MADWLEVTQRARPRLGPIPDLLLVPEVDDPAPFAVQWPEAGAPGRAAWIGGIGGDAGAHGSLVGWHAGPPAPDGTVEGLLIDAWSETIPDATVTPTVAVEASLPPARTPAGALLVPPPDGRARSVSDLRAAADLAAATARTRCLALTDLPAVRAAGLPYGGLGGLLPATALSTAEGGVTAALCPPDAEARH